MPSTPLKGIKAIFLVCRPPIKGEGQRKVKILEYVNK